MASRQLPREIEDVLERRCYSGSLSDATRLAGRPPGACCCCKKNPSLEGNDTSPSTRRRLRGSSPRRSAAVLPQWLTFHLSPEVILNSSGRQYYSMYVIAATTAAHDSV